MGFVDDIARRTRQSRAARYGTLAAISFGSGDYVPYQGETLKQSMRLIGSGSWGVNAIKNYARTIQQSIDPRIERMAPEELLKAGEAFLGNKPSPFITNPEIVTPQDWGKLGQLVEQKLLSEEELNSFMNLLGVNYRNHAQHCVNHTQTPSAQNRAKIAQEHLELAPIIIGTVMQIFSRNPGLRAAAAETMTLDHVKSAFPRVAKIAPLAQYLDDQTDLVMDLLAEHHTGRVCPNYILARADQLGGLTDGKGAFQPEVIDKALHKYRTSSHIKPDELPEVLRAALHGTGEEFAAKANEANPLVKRILQAGWEHSMKRGLSPVKNGRYVSAESLQR